MRLILIILTLCSFFIPSWGEEKKEKKKDSKDMVILPAGQVVNGDYFAFGDSIEISGTVKGDVYAAGLQVYVDGDIEGDLIVIGGSVDVEGNVGHNIRLLAGQATINGSIGRNATVLAGNAQFMKSGKILGNLVCTSGNADLGGSVGGDATLAASNLRISGSIQQKVYAYVGQLRLTSHATIGGGLEYKSNTAAFIDEGAIVHGQIVHQPSLVHNLLKGSFIHGLLIGSKIAGLLMNFLYTFAIGFILIKIYPRRLESTLIEFTKNPVKCFGFGIMLLVLLPLVSLILLMTILGIPFALTLLALNLIGFYTAKVFTVFWVSNRFCSKIRLKENALSTFTIGLVLYFLITSIPIFGMIVAFIAMIFGLGAMVLAKSNLQFIKRGKK
jgi:cytoskeletal protein CcmA (bactofilin family)